MSTQIDRLDGLASSTAIKGPCRCATTANIVQKSGLLTIDGIVLAEDDRVLVKDQTDTRENGIYVVSTGEWRRSRDFYGNKDVRRGTRVRVTDGATNGSLDWAVVATNPVTIDTSTIEFEAIAGFDGNSATDFWQTRITTDANAAAALTGLGVSAFAQTLLDDANAAAALTGLGVSAFAQTLLDDASAATARTTLNAAALAGGNTFSGIQRMPATSRVFGSAAYFSFENNFTGTRTGYVGNGTGIHDDIYLAADNGNIRLIPSAGNNILASSRKIINLADGTDPTDAVNLGQLNALIEYGSNANGEYERYEDGTQICWFMRGTTSPTTTAWGSTYLSASAALTFPVAFISVPTVAPCCRWVSGEGAGSVALAFNAAASTADVTMYAFSGVSSGGTRLGYVAVGRWF